MFKNVLLSFSLLCGFLLPNHINAYLTQIPAVYSWPGSIGTPANNATMTVPTLSAEYNLIEISSVATDASGNAVMVGKAYSPEKNTNNDQPKLYTSLAYSLPDGTTNAIEITLPDLPAGYTNGELYSVATDASGNTVMVGRASNTDSTTSIPLAYSWNRGDSEAMKITLPALPPEYTVGSLRSVAINSSGNIIMVGKATNADSTTGVLLAYSWAFGVDDPTEISLPGLPTGHPAATLFSVAINSSGKIIMGGYAYSSVPAHAPLAYSCTWGSSGVTQLDIPFPTGYGEGFLTSVAINSSGKIIMVGQAGTPGSVNYVPLACYQNPGDSEATLLTTTLPTGRLRGYLHSVAINYEGNAVMGGHSGGASPYFYMPLAYSETSGTASQITTPLPTGSTNGVLWPVAVNSSGNVIMGGSATNADGKWAPLAYEWMGSSDASVIETPPPQLNYRGGSLFSVAINTDGTAIMGGLSTYVAPPTGGAAAGGSFTSGSP